MSTPTWSRAAGWASVVGVDFAEGMLELARNSARRAGVEHRCRFERGDFMNWSPPGKFDYVIAMGFMDYVAHPSAVVAKVMSVAECRAFFSFPLDGGLLAWQRKLRYRRRCLLYMYTEKQIAALFELTSSKINVRRISRDLFVEAEASQAAMS